jgi:hypothetical protein
MKLIIAGARTFTDYQLRHCQLNEKSLTEAFLVGKLTMYRWRK